MIFERTERQSNIYIKKTDRENEKRQEDRKRSERAAEDDVRLVTDDRVVCVFTHTDWNTRLLYHCP